MSYEDTIPYQAARDAGHSEEEAEQIAAAVEAGGEREAEEFEEKVLVPALVNRERAALTPGSLLVVVGGLGIPSIVRVEPDTSWMCVAGLFKGRPILPDATIRMICQDGDTFDDLGLAVRGGQLVPMDRAEPDKTTPEAPR